MKLECIGFTVWRVQDGKLFVAVEVLVFNVSSEFGVWRGAGLVLKGFEAFSLYGTLTLKPLTLKP